MSVNPLTLKTLFDMNINMPNHYFPIINDSLNHGMPLDQL